MTIVCVVAACVLLATTAATASEVEATAPAPAESSQADSSQVDPMVTHPIASYPWRRRILDARTTANNRRGKIGFAIVDEQGNMRGGYRVDQRFRSASVVKTMFMICYLNRANTRNRALTSYDRNLLAPMIKSSNDAAANRVWGMISTSCLHRIARQTGMRNFSTGSVWGKTQITPAGTARMFFRVDRLVTARHRPYARSLLASIVRSQRWGIPPVKPDGFVIRFKGGWSPSPSGHVANQGAMLEKGSRRFSIVVLTDGSPTHNYGTETIRRVARKLMWSYHNYG